MKLFRNSFLLIPILLLVLALLPRCAKVVSPTGGLKDTLAPRLVISIPKIYATNFQDKKVTITFDEYIQLKDIQQKLIISPPMINKPEVRLKGKGVEVIFNEELKENTTYTIYFADGVVDNNESNPIKNFEFVFSTGNSLDSLRLNGVITEAFSLKPSEGMLVMLYDNLSDSTPYIKVPLHVARTDKSGKFILNNLKSSDYKMFALKDGNSNYKFDQSTEEIAFIENPIKKENLTLPSKSKDTLSGRIRLTSFTEEGKIQSLVNFSRDERRRISLTFTKKPEGGIRLIPLGFEALKNWYIPEKNTGNDTLTYWIKEDKLSVLDTLNIILNYQKTDSLFQLFPEVDTLKFIYTEPEKARTRRRDRDKLPETTLMKFKCSIAEGGKAIPTIPMVFTFSTPLSKVDLKKISLINITDSTIIPDLKLTKDSINPRIYRFAYSWKPDTLYNLSVLPGAFVSLDMVLNDTLDISFTGANPEEYGTLSLTLTNNSRATIVELITESDKLLERLIMKKEEKKAIFRFINPGKYRLRIIEDTNGNGKWDTGDYLKKRQPERVFMFTDIKTKGLINVRANWENEINFDFLSQ